MNRLQEIHALNDQIQKKYASLETRTFTQSLTAGIAAGMTERALTNHQEHDEMVAALNEIKKNFP